MVNQLIEVDTEEYQTLFDALQQSAIFVAVIEGKRIANLSQYLEAVWKAFKFPQTGHVNYYAYLDWICDLSWLHADGYALILKDYPDFMSDDTRNRDIVINSLSDKVLTWWQSDIEQFQVEGKAKPFNVYLVD